MKLKYCLSGGLGLVLAASSVVAGTMGDAVKPMDHNIIPFVSGEGFPAWIRFGGITVQRTSSFESADKGTYTSGGARVAAGFVYPFKEKVDFTLETAWNYFGHTSGNISSGSIDAKLYGVDLLVGAAYKYNKIEIFGKIGTLFERADLRFTIPSTYAFTTSSLDYYVATNTGTSITQAIPEVKVGLNYIINPRLAATAAYMHAFGSSPNMALSSINSGSTVDASISMNMKAPTIDAAMFGLRYLFVD